FDQGCAPRFSRGGWGVGGGVGPGEFADDSVPGQAGVDLADQVQVLVGVGGHVHVDQGRPGAFEQVGEFGHEQPGGAGDGAAPSGEGTVGEQSRGVGQQYAFGAAFHHEPGHVGHVLRGAPGPQCGGHFGGHVGVVDQRVFQQQSAGASGGLLPVGARPWRVAEQAGDAAQVLYGAGGPKEDLADLVVDVEQGVGLVAAPGPGLQGAVGQVEGAPVQQPVCGIDQGGLVGGVGGVVSQAGHGVGGGGEVADQVTEADLDLGALEACQDQAQVGRAAPAEGFAPAGEDVALCGVEFVEFAYQSDVVGGGDEGVAEQGT